MTMSCLSKARVALSNYGDDFSLSRTIDAVEQNYTEGLMGASIGQCKNLIESLSKTILDRKTVTYEAGITFPQLVKRAVREINVGGVGNDDQKTHEAFLKIVSSICNNLDNIAESLAALRNDYCPESHGRSAEHIDLPKEYGEFIILQADSLLSFIICLLKRHDEFKPAVIFSEHEDFNNHLYEQFGEIDIHGDLYQAPEILFNLHPQKYKDFLEEFKANEGKDS